LEAIEAKEIKHAYDSAGGRKRALRGVTLEVRRGELLAVLGQNGCGKSTLVKHFNGLVPLQEGELSVAGFDLRTPKNLRGVRRTCGMVFQNPDNQFVSSLVGEDVAFGPKNFGVPDADIPGIVAAALAAVGLTGFEDRSPQMLSGGQKQRTAVAGVLAVSPDIVVFDEATAMLDPEGRREVLAIIRRLRDEHGKTIVMISHYVEEAVAADRVALMQGGKILGIGTPREILTNPALLAEAGLLPPFPVRVYEALRQCGVTLARCPLTEEELAEELCR
jgi:energy-coupling factor transport system ATP-binding protein